MSTTGSTGTPQRAGADTQPTAAGEPDAPARRRRRGRVRRRWWGLGAFLLVAVVVGVGAWAGLATLAAARDLQQVRGDLTALQANPPGDRATLLARLDTADQTLRRANSRLDQPGPAVVAAVPVLGRTVVATRNVARAAEAVVAAGAVVARSSDGLLRDGQVDLDRLRVVQADLAAAAARATPALHALATTDTGWTPAAVGHGVAAAQAQLLGTDVTLTRAAAATRALAGILGADGPRRVLVGLENNAELRGTGGLVSVFATGATRQGRLELDTFRQVGDVADAPGATRSVEAPPDYTANYGTYLANTTLWKNVNMSPDGPTSAAVLARVAGASLGVQPDVVVLLDVPAMAMIAQATGPLAVDDQTRAAGPDLVRALLVDAYAKGQRTGQTARREQLGQAAEAAFQSILGGRASTLDLARALSRAVDGRHLLVWSDRPGEQADLRQAGLAGAVDPGAADPVMVTANNLGDSPGEGNKLDYYVRRELAVDVELRAQQAVVTQTLTLTNTAPAGLVPYVAGPAHPGQINERVDMALSSSASVLGFTQDGSPGRASRLTENGSDRIAFFAELGRGQSTTLVLRYAVPVTDGVYQLQAIPQPLARPAQLAVTVRPTGGDELGPVTGLTRAADGSAGRSGAWTSTLEATARLAAAR